MNNQNEFYRGLEAAARALAGATPPGDSAAAAGAVHGAIDALTGPSPDRPRACAAGCDHCCHFPVGITFPEALALATAIAAAPDLAARVRVAARDAADQAWPALIGLPCPLLVAGRCAAYVARPVPCRSLASRDAGACAAARAGAPTEVPRDDVAYWRGLGAAAALAAMGPGSRELRSALAAVLDAPADGALAAFAAARLAP